MKIKVVEKNRIYEKEEPIKGEYYKEIQRIARKYFENSDVQEVEILSGGTNKENEFTETYKKIYRAFDEDSYYNVRFFKYVERKDKIEAVDAGLIRI